jgi:hypothetical protein
MFLKSLFDFDKICLSGSDANRIEAVEDNCKIFDSCFKDKTASANKSE